jgi:hypothetical protein
MKKSADTIRPAAAMRCVACGVDMELVHTVPDNSMIASARELATFECPRCHGKGQRLVATSVIAPFATEQMQLPAHSSMWAVEMMEKLELLKRKALVVARSWQRRALAHLRQVRR